MLTQLVFATVNGLTTGMAVFLVAAGVTLVFGILNILNFAHGSFFMVGAYVAYTVIGQETESVALLLGASVVSGLAVGALGYVADLAVFKRLQNVDVAYTLIGTFALLLFVNGATKLIWGLDYHSVNPPDVLSDSITFGSMLVPKFSMFIILLGIGIYALLDIVIHRSWIGKVVQIVANDQWMSALVGINVPVFFTGAVVFSFFLAGLAGGLLLPNQSLSPELSSSYLLQAFVVCIIGGLGNVRGAFVASIILGLVESLNSVVMPNLPGLAIYFAMVGFLLWRPQGLIPRRGGGVPDHFGSKEGTGTAEPRTLPKWIQTVILVVATVVVASMPFWANQGLVFLAGIALIEGLFALSWNLMFGYAGLASFGHAALFACGAYFVGYLLKVTDIPFLLLLLGSAAFGAIVAAAVGAVVVGRAAGIGLGILTLALSEILRIFIGYATPLGRDDGLSAIPRKDIDLGFLQIPLSGLNAYFWFLCLAFIVITALMWWLSFNPFGRVLRSIRQDPERTAFLGVKVSRYRLTAFTIAGAVGALAGGLQAPWAQIVTPDAANYLHSTQPMLNTLLGGSEFFWGPLLGTTLFSALQYSTRTLAGLSELISGLVLLVIVIGAPSGVLGILRNYIGRRPTPENVN